MTAKLDCPCPPAGVIDIVGRKWAICVVTLLGRNGALRFGAIQRSLSSASPATLTTTLRSLERAQLVLRENVKVESGSFAAYALTNPGMALYRSLLPLASWLRQT